MAAVQEETVCRICRETGTEVTQRNPLLSPCLCRGTSGHVHLICLEHWVRASGKDTCSICKAQYSGVIVELSRPNFAEFLLDHHFVGGQNLGLFVGSVAITIGLCLSKDVVGRTTGYLAAWSMFDYLMAEYCDRKLRIKVRLINQQ
ncbi:hypothetical protein HDE_09501 [Halotydeus destructor]|nr:hypothetical protein HDE_09501 [Halotydeus destructor]